jgi:hypothetical protein
MNTLTLFFAVSLLLGTASWIAPQDTTFTGEIMDSQCAQMGSHESMIKQEGAKNATECSDACVKAGGKYVLYDAATKAVYQLDDQAKAKEFSGQKVTVMGSKSGKSIHVSSIKPSA